MLPFFTLIPLRLMGAFLIVCGCLINAWAGDATNPEQEHKENAANPRWRYGRDNLRALRNSASTPPNKVIAQLRDDGLLKNDTVPASTQNQGNH
jgi:hypothetical protein